MRVFGENSFGWRISSVVFGTATIALLYFAARELGFSLVTSLLSSGLFSLSGLALGMSRIAMNDMHVTFFVVLSIWLYWRWRKSLTLPQAMLVGLSTGLAVASKWSGVFLLALYLFDHGARLLHTYLNDSRATLRPFAQFWLALAVLVPSMYLLSYGQMFFQGKDLNHFWELHQQIWWYQTNLEATHPYQSTPWEWIMNLRPVYAYSASTATVMEDIYLQENPLLAWIGLLAVAWTALDIALFGLKTAQYVWQSALTQQKKWQSRLLKHWKASTETYRLLFVLAAYGVFWLPWVLSPRIMFFYHYLPSIPFLALLLAHQLTFILEKTPYGKAAVLGVIASIAVTYVAFFPHWTGIAVNRESFDWLYFALSSWR